MADQPQALPVAYNVEADKLIGAAAKSAAARNQKRIWNRINRDAIYLVLIIVLSLLVIAMAVITVSALTGNNVTVVFSNPNAQGSTPTPVPSGTPPTPGSTPPATTDNIPAGSSTISESKIYMLVYVEDNPTLTIADLPNGSESININGQIKAYLVPVPIQLASSNKLAEIVTELSTQGQIVYQSLLLSNAFEAPGLKVFTYEKEAGAMQVDLVGSLPNVSGDQVQYLKSQVLKTAKEINLNSYITLNGSERDWDNLGK